MVTKRGRPVVGTDDLAKRAQQLREKGLTVRAIGARLGVSKSLAGELIHVDFEAKRQAARDLKDALREQELDGMRDWFRQQMDAMTRAETEAQSTYSDNAQGWS